MEIIKKKVTTVTETTTYKLHPNLRLVESVVNGKLSNRMLHYAGKTIKDGNYSRYFIPVYNPDLTYLEKTNPWWFHRKTTKEDEKWFEGNPLPDKAEDIDVNKVIFACSYDHSFWNINMEPVPVVINGDYIDARIKSTTYDLKKLHAHFSKHKQVKDITDIEPVPYYNNEGGEYCFSVTVLPTVKQLKELMADKKRFKSLFYQPWGEDKDYLGMKRFYLNKEIEY